MVLRVSSEVVIRQIVVFPRTHSLLIVQIALLVLFLAEDARLETFEDYVLEYDVQQYDAEEDGQGPGLSAAFQEVA